MNHPNLFIIMLVMMISACDGLEPDNESQPIAQKFFIPNYGNFGSDNSSLSVYSPKEDSLLNDVYHNVTDKRLGKGSQSALVIGNRVYITHTDDAYISVLSVKTYERIDSINTGAFSGPNYMISPENGIAYVTNLYGGEVLKINLNTSTVEKRIDAGSYPWQLIHINGKIYVASSGFGSDNKILVIDRTLDSVVDTLTVEVNPNFLAKRNDLLIIQSTGDYGFYGSQINGKIYLYDTRSDMFLDTLMVSGNVYSEMIVDKNGNLIYNFNGLKMVPINRSFGSESDYSSYNGSPVYDSESGTLYAIGFNNSSESEWVEIQSGIPISKGILGIFPSGSTAIYYSE